MPHWPEKMCWWRREAAGGVSQTCAGIQDGRGEDILKGPTSASRKETGDPGVRFQVLLKTDEIPLQVDQRPCPL